MSFAVIYIRAWQNLHRLQNKHLVIRSIHSFRLKSDEVHAKQTEIRSQAASDPEEELQTLDEIT